MNKALKTRLEAAIATLAARPGGAPVARPEDPPIAVQTQSFVSGVFSPDKFSSLTLLMAARRDASGEPDARARLFIVPNAHVSRLIVPPVFRDGGERDGYRVSGIDLFVDGGRRFLPIAPTATVVLALGCIESTRLALESFPSAADRPDNRELMGSNLMAHLRFDFPFEIDRQAFADWVQQETGQTLRQRLQTASFHMQGDTPDGRFHLQVYATGETAGSEEGLLYRMIPDADVARRLADQQKEGRIRLIFRACGEMPGNRTPHAHESNRSWIDLASPADRDQTFEHARAFVHYADVNAAPIWGRMRAACVALANEIGAMQLPGEDRHEVGSTWHDSGTLFMGGPDDGVTDTSGFFHHIANAACVDQAVFPTVGSANPVLTGLCLARKTAETIVDRFVSAPELADDQIARGDGRGLRVPAGRRQRAEVAAERTGVHAGAAGADRERHDPRGARRRGAGRPVLRRSAALRRLRAAAAVEGVPRRRRRHHGELGRVPAYTSPTGGARRRHLLSPRDRNPDRRHGLRRRSPAVSLTAPPHRRHLWPRAGARAGAEGTQSRRHARRVERLPDRRAGTAHPRRAERPPGERGGRAGRT